jgi:oligopeptide transport system substrate-binding protein
MSIVEDPFSVLNSYRRKELDWMGQPFSELPLEGIEQLKEERLLHTQEVAGVFLYHFNVERPPFQSIKIRQAFAYALDKQKLIDEVLKGGERQAKSLLPPWLSLLDDQEFSKPQLLVARALFEEGLEEIGLSREELPPIILSYGGIEGQLAQAQAVQRQWEEAFGISVKLEAFEWNVYLAEAMQRRYQITGLLWYSWYNDPMYNLEPLKYRSNSFNYSQWEHPHYRELLDMADQESDQKKRLLLLKQAEEIVLDHSAVVPVYVINFKYVKQPELQGVYISQLGLVDFRWAHLSAPQEPNLDREFSFALSH